MAKSRKKKGSKKAAAAAHHTVAKPSYSGNKYDCYGKHVRAGKSKKKIARVFCGKEK